MGLFDIIAVLLVLAALFSYVNHRWVGLPSTIGVMLIALLSSLALVALRALGLDLSGWAERLLGQIDFNEALMNGMLSFLLFAGALHVDLGDLWSNKWTIGTLATLGVVASTLLIGLFVYEVLGVVGLELPLVYCFLFGALISPTDPIAVLGILKTSGAPGSLRAKISGESLFNDGVGVVVFIIVLAFATTGGDITAGDVALLFVREALGGAALGFAAGLLTFCMLRSVDRYQVEVLLSLALVAGGYALAQALHLSGPIAIVVAGLLIGNHGRMFAMSERTRMHLDTFWELTDEVLNAVLFLLLGLEVLVVHFAVPQLLAGLAVIPCVLAVRFVAVGVPVTVLRLVRSFSRHAVKIMVWGGLRGAISVALALSLPSGSERDLIVAMTYVVVVFSVVVQGVTVGPLARWAAREA